MRCGWVATLAVLLQGCIGSWAYEGLVFDRECRQGMLEIVADDVFSIHAFAGSSQARDAGAVLTFLNRILTHYAAVAGREPTRRFSIYLHSPDHFEQEGGGYLPAGGMAWSDDFSSDIPWQGTDRSQETAAHELAHLVDFDLGGGNARAFLVEGFAEYLASAVPFSYSGLDEAPGTAADGLADHACDGSWSLRAVFPAAAWFQAHDRHAVLYQAAALFTELLVEKLGFWGYRTSFYRVAAKGTTNDAEGLLLGLTGRSFAGLERELRGRALQQVTPYRPCGRGYGECPDACRCQLSAGSDVGRCALR